MREPGGVFTASHVALPAVFLLFVYVRSYGADPTQIEHLVSKLEQTTSVSAEYEGIVDVTHTLTATDARVGRKRFDYVSVVYRVKSTGERQLVVALVDRWLFGVTVRFVIDSTSGETPLDGVYDLHYEAKLGPLDSVKFRRAVQTRSMYRYESRARPRAEGEYDRAVQETFDSVVREALGDEVFYDYYANRPSPPPASNDDANIR